MGKIKIFRLVNCSGKTVSANGKILDIAKKDFQIVELLSVNCGQVFNRERIYEKIRGYNAEGDSTVIAEHIRRTRSKLAKFGEEYHIETFRGMGYKWVK